MLISMVLDNCSKLGCVVVLNRVVKFLFFYKVVILIIYNYTVFVYVFILLGLLFISCFNF